MEAYKKAPFRSAGFINRSIDMHRSGHAIYIKSGHNLHVQVSNIVEWLAYWAAVKPNELLLAERIDDSNWRQVSYRSGYERVGALAAYLLGRDAPQEPIALAAENSIACALFTWAAHLAGAPVIVFNPRHCLSTHHQKSIFKFMKSIGANLLVVDNDKGFEELLGDNNELQAITLRALEDNAALEPPIHAGSIDPWLVERLPSGDHIAKYLFTSGSSGKPKCVPMTHKMLAAAQAAVCSLQPSTGAPVRTLDWLPWHHVMGANVSLARTLLKGGTFYIDDGRPVPGQFEGTLRNIYDVQPTLFSAVPAVYEMLTPALEENPELAKRFFSPISNLTYGGAPLSEDIHQRLLKVSVLATGERISITSGYGATEVCGPGLTVYWEGAPVNTLGLPYAGGTAKLTPTEDGAFDLALKSPSVFTGYLMDEAEFDEEGYYRTGDRVSFLDPERPEEGLRFEGRSAEMFKLASGTWVRVESVRDSLAAAFPNLFKHIVICGEGRQSAAALVWPQVPSVDQQASLETRLKVFNQGRSSSEKVERIMIMKTPPSAKTGEITDKGGVNVRALRRLHHKNIERLYGAADVIINHEFPII